MRQVTEFIQLSMYKGKRRKRILKLVFSFWLLFLSQIGAFEINSLSIWFVGGKFTVFLKYYLCVQSSLQYHLNFLAYFLFFTWCHEQTQTCQLCGTVLQPDLCTSDLCSTFILWKAFHGNTGENKVVEISLHTLIKRQHNAIWCIKNVPCMLKKKLIWCHGENYHLNDGEGGG